MRSTAAFFTLALFSFGCDEATPTGGAPRSSAAPEPSNPAPTASAVASTPVAAAPPSASAKAPPASPIDAALPATGLLTPSQKLTCDAKTACDFTKAAPSAVLPKDSHAPVMLFGADIPKGGMALFPRYESIAVAAIVLEGKVDVQPADSSKGTKSLGAWQGIFAPGGFVRLIANEGPARVAIVVGSRPQGSERGVGAELARGGAKGNAERPGSVVVFDLAAREDLSWGGGAYHARIGWDAGADKPVFVVDTLRFSKDAGVAKHIHEDSWELLAILDGEGKLEIEREPGHVEDVKLTSGAQVTIPPKTPHAYAPAGTAPLLALQVYAPPGPEARFKKLAHP